MPKPIYVYERVMKHYTYIISNVIRLSSSVDTEYFWAIGAAPVLARVWCVWR